eukprot:scaffold4.g5044.t1
MEPSPLDERVSALQTIVEHVINTAEASAKAVEQAEAEISALQAPPAVTAANAELMAEVRHAGSPTTQEAAASSKSSVASQGGDLTWLVESPPSSIAGGSESSAHAGVRSTAPCPTAAEVVAPMPRNPHPRTEIANEVDDSLVELRGHLSMRKDKSMDFRKARSYDFDTPVSPRVGARGSPPQHAQSPLTPQTAEDSATPIGSQSTPRSRSLPATPLASFSAPPAQLGPLPPPPLRFQAGFPRDVVPPSPRSRALGPPPSPSAATAAAAGGRCMASRPILSHGRSPRSSRRRLGEAHCSSADGAPPGLNPLARVQGHIDHEGPGWLGTESPLDAVPCSPSGQAEERLTLEQLSASPYETHSLTPPQQVGAGSSARGSGAESPCDIVIERFTLSPLWQVMDELASQLRLSSASL